MRSPSELVGGFGGIAAARYDVSVTKKRRIGIDVIAPIKPNGAKRAGCELLEGIALSGSDHVVIRISGPQHQPHRLDIFWRPTPVTGHIIIAYRSNYIRSSRPLCY
jgi:hypothetical protein